MKQKTGRVLLVDDEISALETASAVLSDDFDVVSCRSAEEALLQLSQGDFHVVCTDFQMPGMKGDELINKALLHAEYLYGIMLTGHVEAPRRDLDGNGRRVGFLFKPYDPDRLIQLINQFVRFSEMKRKIQRLGAVTPQQPQKAVSTPKKTTP
jgi:DNA-binding NtrC family response regulator